MASLYTPWIWRRGGTVWNWLKKPTRCEHVKTTDSFSAFRTRDCLHWRTDQPNQNGCLDKGPKKFLFRELHGKMSAKETFWLTFCIPRTKTRLLMDFCSAFSYAYGSSPSFKKAKSSNIKTNQSTSKKEVETRSIACFLFVCLFACVCVLVLLYIRGKQIKKTIQCKSHRTPTVLPSLSCAEGYTAITCFYSTLVGNCCNSPSVLSLTLGQCQSAHSVLEGRNLMGWNARWNSYTTGDVTHWISQYIWYIKCKITIFYTVLAKKWMNDHDCTLHNWPFVLFWHYWFVVSWFFYIKYFLRDYSMIIWYITYWL